MKSQDGGLIGGRGRRELAGEGGVGEGREPGGGVGTVAVRVGLTLQV